jgi:hypothetical protein
MPKKPDADESTLPSPEPTPAIAPAAEQLPHPTAAVVETWFQTHFHNMSALFDARAYSVLLGAKEELKQLLAAL